MILALEEDGVLRIYRSPEDAYLSVEGLDAEATFIRIFDEVGQPYSIAWERPNDVHSLLGVGAAASGRYHFVPVGPPDPQGLCDLLSSTRSVEPPGSEPLLRELATAVGRTHAS
jgi:hypothetical protein